MDDRSSTASNVRRFENPDEDYVRVLEIRIAELEEENAELEGQLKNLVMLCDMHLIRPNDNGALGLLCAKLEALRDDQKTVS